jgi:hypothetical protein
VVFVGKVLVKFQITGIFATELARVDQFVSAETKRRETKQQTVSRMNTKLSLAVALALAAGAMSYRALGQVPSGLGPIPSALTPSLVMDPICFDLTIGYIPSGNFEVYFVPGGLNPWEIRVDFNSLVSPATVSGYAQHYVAPHPGEVVPNTAWTFSFTTAVVPDSAGPTDVPHLLPSGAGDHSDQFFAEFSSVPGGFLLNVSGCHIPEPADYAALAGLGLLGFGAYRRFRKA